jgi:hypothetical protein
MESERPISMWRNGPRFLGLNQRVPAITSMSFHPHHMVMAAAAEDSHLAVRLSFCAIRLFARGFPRTDRRSEIGRSTNVPPVPLQRRLVWHDLPHRNARMAVLSLYSTGLFFEDDY